MKLRDAAVALGRQYIATGTVAATVLAGSVGRGRADEYSDIELDSGRLRRWQALAARGDLVALRHACGIATDAILGLLCAVKACGSSIRSSNGRGSRSAASGSHRRTSATASSRHRRARRVPGRSRSSVAAASSYGLVVGSVVTVGRQPRWRLADLLIAATAHANGLDLFTRNADDFIGLEGLVRIVAL